MKTEFKKTLLLLFVGLSMSVLVSASVSATESVQIPESAPLSNAFVEYQNNLSSGTLEASTVSGHEKGYIPPPLERYDGTEAEVITQSATLPSSYDLRKTGRITAIRDQGNYGSCWTFASLASLESYIKGTQSVDLSENNLMWNHGFDGGPDDGGNYDMATAYLARWSGPVNESSDPYGTAQKTGLQSTYHVQSVEYIPPSATAIKEALMAGGALDASMYSGALEDDYYFNSDTSALYYNGNDDTDHDVAIVGWDDNYDKKNFTNPPPGNGAWIIKNSWGSDWGDQGYFYMSYYDTYSGSNVTAFHSAEATSNFSRIYQYDPLGNVSAKSYHSSDNTAWGANIFTAVASENLTAISTYASSPNTTLQIMIYNNVANGQPTSGSLVGSQTATFGHGGYYTINLNTPVKLTAGQKFAVVIRYQTPGTNNTIPVEVPEADYSSAASANSGESFTSNTGSGSWYDVSGSEDANVCIKAFTSNQVGVLLGIAITNPAQKLTYQVGDALDLSGLEVTGTYSDGSSKILDLADVKVTGFDSSTAVSSQTLTITVDGKTTSYNIRIVSSESFDVDCLYRTHVQNEGWQSWRSNGEMSGTEGKSYRLEGIEIKLQSSGNDLGIEYCTHIQNEGWQDFRSDGEMSGTTGKSLRMEAIKIQLTGADADLYDVYYRVHAQNVGWMDWASNGEAAGTAGFGYRLEGIEIQIVPKGTAAPGPTDLPFISAI